MSDDTPLWSCPTAMSAMFTPAAPTAAPTRPIIPGTSSLRTTIMLRAGGRSTWKSSSITILGTDRNPVSVPATLWPPDRTEMRFT